ncbi:MAG: type II secretion system protein [Planctomycetota bacterium]|jgi:prepilin-type N-terminal cleavage/methylation domain-containing protein/prepilin-type processing-associated H-X9-DG protein
MGKRRAFTLIELLVVIAIIALLMAIMMPALQKARHQSRRTACAAHLKSCGYAGVLYANDNEGQFPPCHMDLSPGSGSYAVWISGRQDDPQTKGFMAHGLFFHHRLITEPKLFYCPGNNNPTLKYGEASATSAGGGWPRGEIPDALGPNQTWVQTTYHYRSLWDEHGWRSVNSVKDSGGMAFMADMFSDPSRGVQHHHKNGYNVAYTDGHSEFVRDLEHGVRDFGDGATYHVDHSRQDYVWKRYFDRITKYKPHREY